MAQMKQISVRELRVRKNGYLSTEDIIVSTPQPGATSSRVALSRPDRKAIMFFNTTPEMVWLRAGANTVGTSGIPLLPLGGSVLVNFENDGDLATIEWFAQSQTGSFAIQVTEVVGLVEVPAAPPA